MYETLRDFVRALDTVGELARVTGAVSPVLEVAALADLESKKRAAGMPSESARRADPRLYDRGGRALMLTNVVGSEVPVLINGWGSYRRMEMALGCERGGFAEIAGRIGELVKPQPPRSIGEAWEKLKTLAPLLRTPPKRLRGSGLCQEVVETGEAVDLTRLPMIRCWPHDGDYAALGYPAGVNDGIEGLGRGPDWEVKFRGRYVTLGGIHTIHADDEGASTPSSHNIGMYRVQLLGPRTMAMHWHMHHDGARHWRSWKRKGKSMPVAIALGGESVMPYAATAPLPPGISELLLAGFLNGRGIPMVMGKTVPVWVPANAEMVIEGYVSHVAGGRGWDPRDMSKGPNGRMATSELGPGAVFEGPFGDHTGFYSMPDRYPILTVTAVTHRRDPIYPTTVVGLPPQEDYFLGKATERIFLPLLKTLIHDIEDYDLPVFGAFHNCAMVRIKKEYPFQGRRVMHSVWGAGQMAWTKSVIVVDQDVDVHDAAAVLRAVGERCVPGRDIEEVKGTLSPAAADLCAAGEIPAVLGESARRTEDRVTKIEGVLDARIPAELGGWWMLVRMKKERAGDGAVVIKALGGLPNEVEIPRWTVVVGEDASVEGFDDALFHWLANGAPDRDRYLSVCGRRVAFDATAKVAGDERHGLPVRAWPPILRMPAEVVDRVSGLVGE
jgi:4-hydroxy-3-polyprenylbenzoate decarboxylase